MTLANWLLYSGLTGLLLTLAAWQADRAAGALRSAARWYWLLAGLGTVGLPLLALVRPPGSSDRVLPVGPEWHWAAVSDANRLVEPWATTAPRQVPSLASANPRLAWLLASVAALGWVIISQRGLPRRRRGWRRDRLLGVAVAVSPDLGPAVIGLLRPEIVVPEWVAALPEDALELILRHESEHLRSHDSRLLGAMVALLVVMPWQPFLWLQLAGLRLGIEVDCDRRVLRRGPDVRGYAELLLELAGRIANQSPARVWGLPLVSLWTRPSQLEGRIRAMSAPRSRGRSLVAASTATVALVLACATRAPRVDPALAGLPTDLSLAPAYQTDGDSAPASIPILRRYVEHYFSPVDARRSGGREPMYFFVADETGRIISHDTGWAGMVSNDPAWVREHQPWMLADARSRGDSARLHELETVGLLSLDGETVYRRYPAWPRRQFRFGEWAAVPIGADTVNVVWVQLEAVLPTETP
jgi:hypothetical protein